MHVEILSVYKYVHDKLRQPFQMYYGILIKYNKMCCIPPKKDTYFLFLTLAIMLQRLYIQGPITEWKRNPLGNKLRKEKESWVWGRVRIPTGLEYHCHRVRSTKTRVEDSTQFIYRYINPLATWVLRISLLGNSFPAKFTVMMLGFMNL